MSEIYPNNAPSFMARLFGHLKTVMKHKHKVFILCCKAGIPWQGLTHDLSKFSITELSDSVKYWTGKRSPLAICKEKNGYSKAWLHHKGRNKHHYEYWYDNTAWNPTPIIPYKYVAEMICDNLAAGLVYRGNSWSKEYQAGYWERTKDSALVNDKIKLLLTAVYDRIATYGIDAVVNKKVLSAMYDEYVK